MSPVGSILQLHLFLPFTNPVPFCTIVSVGGYNKVSLAERKSRSRLSMEDGMKVQGGCHCGEVRYEAEVNPSKVVICHCTDCQTLSGSAFRTVAQTEPGTFRLISGTPKVYVKMAESGNRREQTFCPNCGTPIYSAPAGGGIKAVGLRVGTIRQRDELIPNDQYWFRSSRNWLANLPKISKRDLQPVFDANGAFAE
jgi:hypothetical protein